MTRKATVIHSLQIWLPRTQSWLYDLVKGLPATVASYIVCEQSQLLQDFALPNLHIASDRSFLTNSFDRAGRKFGKRVHLRFAAENGRRIGADIWHSHFGTTGWVDMNVVRSLDARHVVSFYGFDVSALPARAPIWRRRYADLFKTVTMVLCEGEFMAQTIRKLGCPADRIVVHRLGVDVDHIPFQPRRWSSGERFRVFMAAAFREKKGIPFAIEALGKLRDANVELTIVGGAENNEHSRAEKQKIERALASTGMRARTRLLGFTSLSDMRREALDHHLFLAPSVHASNGDSEGGAPVTLMEMAASGIPIVSSRHCDIPGVIVDGDTGWLADERDVDGLAQHIEWWMANPGKWQPLLAAGRTRIEKEFNARIQGQRLADIYIGLTASGASAIP